MEKCDESKTTPKRKFVEAWLTDDRYKSWIRQVPLDNTLFSCYICNKSFSCSSSHVSRHAESACHKKNIKENVSHESNENMTDKRHRTKKFRQQWLDIKDFQLWLRDIPNDDKSAFCIICDKAFSGGLSQIYRHAESKMHKDKSGNTGIGTNESNKDSNEQTEDPLMLFDERKKSAEIRYAALVTEKNIPHQTAKEILSFFQHIGDPNVLQNMSMGGSEKILYGTLYDQ